jgi:hypothetical protein
MGQRGPSSSGTRASLIAAMESIAMCDVDGGGLQMEEAFDGLEKMG